MNNKNLKNLLENIKWTEWSPRKELSPEFITGNDKLSIKMGDSATLYGKFLSDAVYIDSPVVIFEASFSCGNVKNEEKCIFAMISFYNGEKVLLERDYADIITGADGKKLYRKLDAPENSAYLILEIGVRWCAGAVVEFEHITLKTAESGAPRLVRIATTYQEQHDTPEENLQDMIDVINKAGEVRPDVVLLSELVYESYYKDRMKLAQPVPGPLTEKIGEYAAKHNTYVIFSMNELAGDIIYNTAVIIGRDGKVCGKYRKIHLPLNEAEDGTSPGDMPGIFDLDFGRIGIIICYDQMFPESSRTLALMGAEVIFNPTTGEDPILQQAIARSNGIYHVVSGYGGAKSSRIINPLGEILNCVQSKEAAYAVEEIDLNKRHFVYWMSVGPGNGELNSLFKKERAVNTYDSINKEAHKIKYF
jgi:predicted amidohydrolase